MKICFSVVFLYDNQTAARIQKAFQHQKKELFFSGLV